MTKSGYPKYKPSHIDWIGDIPENWGKWKISHLFKVDRGRVIDKTQITVDQNNDQIYPVFSSQTQNNGCLGYIDTYDYNKDSITWTTDGANAGSVFYRQGKFNATNVCGILTMINKNQSYEYLTYCIRVAAFNNRRVDILGYKLMSNEMASIRIPLPPLTEQQFIATYLDDKITKIDQAIALKKNQIELLKEKRTAMINQAVTKGLDPDMEMVESGIEWIGKIPKGWEVKKLKYLVRLINKKSDNIDNGIYVGLEHIESRSGKLLPVGETDEVDGETNAFEKGDLLFNKLRPYLAKAFVAEFDGNCTGELLVMKMGSLVNNTFMKYKVLSQSFLSIVNNSTYGAKMPRASWDFIGTIEIGYPDIVGQQAIVHYLDCETAVIDQTIVTVQYSIDLLVEYKQSLISHVVTGKVKVF